MTDQEKSFIESCIEGDLKSMILCIKHNVNVNVENDWVISICARKHHHKIAKYLLSKNLVSHKSASTKGLLAYACNSNNFEFVKHLISQSDEYKTDSAAFSWTASNGNIKIAELLVNYLNSDCLQGGFCRAAEVGHIQFLEFLFLNSIDDIDNSANRAIHWAKGGNRDKVIIYLSNNGLGLKNET